MKLVNALEQFAWTQKPSSSSPPTATQAINTHPRLGRRRFRGATCCGRQCMSERRILMIGSQCRALGRLAFLPQAAQELYAVMTDPERGALRIRNRRR